MNCRCPQSIGDEAGVKKGLRKKRTERKWVGSKEGFYSLKIERQQEKLPNEQGAVRKHPCGCC